MYAIRSYYDIDLDALTGWLGHRLMTRGIKLEGITNGFNPEDFDTTQPEQLGLAAAFNPATGDIAGKKICTQKLLDSVITSYSIHYTKLYEVTIHNAGHGHHQEVRDLPFARAVTGLPDNLIQNNLLDGAFDPFLAASPYAVLNTVSENYAKELREKDDDA